MHCSPRPSSAQLPRRRPLRQGLKKERCRRSRRSPSRSTNQDSTARPPRRGSLACRLSPRAKNPGGSRVRRRGPLRCSLRALGPGDRREREVARRHARSRGDHEARRDDGSEPAYVCRPRGHRRPDGHVRQPDIPHPPRGRSARTRRGAPRRRHRGRARPPPSPYASSTPGPASNPAARREITPRRRSRPARALLGGGR